MNQGIFQVVCNEGEVEYFSEGAKRRVRKGDVLVMRQELYVEKLTDKQLNLAHMWFNEIANCIIARGNTKFKDGEIISKELFKDRLKATYMPSKNIPDLETGEMVKVSCDSLTKLSMRQMCEFLRKVEGYASSKRIPLTRPNDQEYENYIQQWEAQNG